MTIIDTTTIEMAINPIADSINVMDGYDLPGGDTCFAVECEPRNYTQLMIEIAALDPRLATDMHDVVKDVGVGTEHIYYFPGFELEQADDGDVATGYGEDPLGGSWDL